jgi:hypothetical protein
MSDTLAVSGEMDRLEQAVEAAVVARIDAEDRFGKGSAEHRSALLAQDAASEALSGYYGEHHEVAVAREIVKRRSQRGVV